MGKPSKSDIDSAESAVSPGKGKKKGSKKEAVSTPVSSTPIGKASVGKRAPYGRRRNGKAIGRPATVKSKGGVCGYSRKRIERMAKERDVTFKVVAEEIRRKHNAKLRARKKTRVPGAFDRMTLTGPASLYKP